MRSHISKKTREKVYAKYGNRCAYCGEELVKGNQCVDHIEPIAKAYYNGVQPEELNKIENYNPSCRLCNSKKSSMSIKQFRGYIQTRIETFMQYNSDYRLANKYGILPHKTLDRIEFYFESINKEE